MVPIRSLVALLTVVLASSQVLAGPAVRVPRDSPLIVNGVVRPPTGNVRAPTTAEPRAAAASRATACTSPLVPDPGYRPMWVPGDWCWTGGESVWVPGHWVW